MEPTHPRVAVVGAELLAGPDRSDTMLEPPVSNFHSSWAHRHGPRITTIRMAD